MCIVFSIGESPRVCGRAKVSSIAPKMQILQIFVFLFFLFFFFLFCVLFFAHGRQPLLIRLFSGLKLL